MKKVLIVAILLCLVIALPVSARTLVIQAEGEVEYFSRTKNEVSTAAVSIQGNGKLDYKMSGETGAASLSQEHEMAMTGPMTAIVALFSAAKEYAKLEDEDERYIYAVMVAPAEGESGKLSAKFNTALSEEAIYSFDVEVEAEVTGELRNYIEMYNPTSEVKLYEEMRINGWAYYLDLF